MARARSTAGRQVEQAQRTDERYFLSLAESLDLVLWMRDLETDRIVYVSPAYEVIWERTRESLYESPQSFFDAIHPDDRERTAAALPARQQSESGVEFRLVKADGSVRWISVRTFPILGPQGDITRIAGIAQDITRQKNVEETLRSVLARTQERYILSRRIGAARTADDVLHALRSLTTFSDANRAAVLLFDRPWEDTPPGWCSVLAEWRDNADLPSLAGERYPFERYEFARQFLRDETVLIGDVQTDPRVGGNIRGLLTRFRTRSIVLFPLITGNQWYGMLTFHSESARIVLPEDLSYFEKVVNQAAASIYNFLLLEAETKARHEAEEANELKVKFLAMISHELRTPLTSIKGFATTLLADDVTWDPASQRDFLKTISQEADKLTELIEHLLDLSRLESGTLRIVPEEQRLEDTVQNALPQLQTLAGDHPLIVALPGDLPPVTADPQRVQQVLLNLVSNAAKYSPAGTPITVAAGARQREIQISVADQGPGIPPEERQRVFEAFHRVEREDGTAALAKGVGLGLAICKSLIEAHGGKIWVDDRAEPGTTIAFTLPIARRADADG